MTQELEERLEQALAPAASRRGIELVAIEIVGVQSQPTLRIYLDREGGISLDAICDANEWISSLLDELDPFEGAYTLEVSSPGIDRPLRKLADFERFIGSVASVRTRPVEGRTRFVGTITGVGDDLIDIEADDTAFHIPFADVRDARLKGEVDFGQQKGGCER
ncbi:MAG: ribosome maturation factor RimP [Coriobacteriia bacterium]|jgi:ribosome maturation factor RimP|nr:ribosome maturation factor RimP [Coriobacteriia bacterium]